MDRILFVDDERFLHSAMQRVMRSVYELSNAMNGEEGLAKACAEQFDLILSDIRMPGMSGVEMVTRLRASGITTPIVFLSGDASEHEGLVQHMLLEGIVQGYVGKPFIREHLLEVIGNTIAARKQA